MSRCVLSNNCKEKQVCSLLISPVSAASVTLYRTAVRGMNGHLYFFLGLFKWVVYSIYFLPFLGKLGNKYL